jgi:hypothetical protein
MPSQQTYQLPHQPPQSLSEEQPRYQLQDEQHRPSVVDQRNHIGGPRELLTPVRIFIVLVDNDAR